ncbi:MAG: hypothetical protein KBS79_04325 [Lachnospiraceae bacterium]|nr:hypothetical protein [Candidatus Minthocola equi]
MTVVLTVLKIIGLVLTGLIALLLLLLLALLFVPIRYRFKGDAKKADPVDADVTAGASWLLHIINCKAHFNTANGLDGALRFLFIKLKSFGKKEDVSEPAEKVAQPAASPEAAPAPEEKVVTDYPEEISEKELDDILKEDTQPESEKTVCDKVEDFQESDSANEEPEKKSFKETILEKYNNIKQKLTALYEKALYYKNQVEDPENQRAARLVLSRTIKLLKHFRPRKLKGRARIGFADPSTTGKILAAYYAVLPPSEHFRLTGEFNEEVIDGNLWFKGHLRLIHILIFVIVLWKDPTVRSWIKKGE